MAEKSATASAGKAALLIVFLVVFIDLLGFGMVLPLLPIYGKQFAAHYGFSAKTTGYVVGMLMASFSLAQFVFNPFWGRVSDRIGRRPVLLVGLAGSVIFYSLFGVATMMQNLVLLFIARIGAGIAGATISTAQAAIADSTPLAGRARGMAMIGAAFGLGFTFGPLLAATALWLSHDAGLSPWPGFTAAMLSAVALMLALAKLPETKTAASPHARRVIDPRAMRDALSVPSIWALLLASFISVFSFGAFETTLALMLDRQFALDMTHILLFFAYIGLMLSLIQGGLVRQLAKRVSEVHMALAGAAFSILGFFLLATATTEREIWFLMLAAAVEVLGFAFMTPSISSLISRRSDPQKQGGILGVAQSTGAMARILGPISIPLFYIHPTLPYYCAIGLMFVATGVIRLAARSGHDYGSLGQPLSEPIL